MIGLRSSKENDSLDLPKARDEAVIMPGGLHAKIDIVKLILILHDLDLLFLSEAEIKTENAYSLFSMKGYDVIYTRGSTMGSGLSTLPMELKSFVFPILLLWGYKYNLNCGLVRTI